MIHDLTGTPARGTTYTAKSGHKAPRLQCSFPRDLFDKIAAEAAARGLPAAAVVRERMAASYALQGMCARK